MSDIFTLKTITLTPELGMALKNFRIENKITAKSITEKFSKASSYISKLENGDIKKIEGDFLIQICNYIANSNDGLTNFLNRLSQNFKEFSNETKLMVMNIDDLLVEYTVPANLVSEISQYLSSHDLTVTQLVDKINANEDIADREDYNILPINIWYDKSSDVDNAAIKLSIPLTYIEDILNQNAITIHRVIAEAILYSLYKLGNEENPRFLAHNKLDFYHMLPARRNETIKFTQDDIDNILSILEPDTADALKNVESNLRLITSITNNYGSKKIKQISNNMDEDLGFYFAYMSVDIVELEKKTKEKKTQFLKELKSLVEKYSQDDKVIDLYE